MSLSTDKPQPGSRTDDETVVVDARELRCPLPLLRTKQALRDLPAGARVRVLATDAGSVRDLHAFVELAGHRMLSFEQGEGVYTYLIEKS